MELPQETEKAYVGEVHNARRFYIKLFFLEEISFSCSPPQWSKLTLSSQSTPDLLYDMPKRITNLIFINESRATSPTMNNLF